MEYLAELLKKKLSEQSDEEINRKWEKLDSEYGDTTDNDFAVHMHERYGHTKEEFERMFVDDNTEYSYEERSCKSRRPNIDFDKLFCGARLYKDERDIMSIGSKFEEIEITHIYSDVAFYKWITGKFIGKEEHFEKDTLVFYLSLYPKIIYKPKQMRLNCLCDKTLVLDEN